MDTSPSPQQLPEPKDRKLGRTLAVIVGVAIVIVGIVLSRSNNTAPSDRGNAAEKENLIRVSAPEPNSAVKSPLAIRGEARGNWFFEASFPMRLVDEEGTLLGSGIAKTKDEWMTEEFVPFEAKLEFEKPAADVAGGMLILEKNNPSGFVAVADELRIPVRFEIRSSESSRPRLSLMLTPSPRENPPLSSPLPHREGTMTVYAYFRNPKLGPQTNCSKVFPFERSVPTTVTVGRAALEELLKGPTSVEKEQGFETSVNPGVKLKNLIIEGGVAKADFDAELGARMSGSCRVAAIRAEITETLKQFPTVREVVISIDGRTEDILKP